MHQLAYWEIPSTDLGASSAFFTALVGWKMNPSTDDYVMFTVEGGMGGGIPEVEAPPPQGIRVYIEVEDIPATLAKVLELGGHPKTPKTEIGSGYGFWADFEEPGGSRVGLWSRS